MKNYTLGEIPPDSYFTKTVYLDDRFVIAAPEMPFSRDLITILGNWEFREVRSEGEPREDYVAEETAAEEADLSPAGMAASDADKIKRAGEFYISFQKYVEKLFTQVAIKNELSFSSVAEKIKTVCDIIREDRRFLMRVQKNTEPGDDQNYLTSHAVRSTIIAIIIGSYLKLPNHRLIELGVAALLHEIGMIKLPPQVYLNKRPLNPQEYKAILTHPVLSFNMLKSFDFPLVVSLAALEHHERE
ncbi:MAG: HD domain-containing protein, partial [Treponema sp.]|nr:HD domain-containing protein [Treponema sp.]